MVAVRGEALTVPVGCYFMAGDNRENSIDSRYWDEPFVPRERIMARLWTAKEHG
ncbi:MAG: S26 family signal peptidase [Clostridiales bacterium]|jgi:signal peptidase I|nr:S26 family signal peptidase [Clostridiales bacterium]